MFSEIFKKKLRKSSKMFLEGFRSFFKAQPTNAKIIRFFWRQFENTVDLG